MKDQFTFDLDAATPPGEQLLLDLPKLSGSGREDVVTGASNGIAAAHLDAWPDWPQPLTVLAGPSGSGKSHLARCWAQRVGADTFDPRLLDDVRLGDQPFLIEDADRGGLDERALFHIVNAARARGLTGLVTARHKPGVWRVGLPDLLSRLRAAVQVELDVPDDALVGGVAVKLFAERQVEVGPEVIETIQARAGRSLVEVHALVKRLDYLSLTRARPVTRSLVLEALRMEASALR